MSVTVEARHEYDFDLDTVIEAFTDPEFYEAKFEGIGARKVEVLSSDQDDDVFTVETRRDVPLEVPGFLKKVLGDWTTMLQSERWAQDDEGNWFNELDMSGDGVPAKMTGTMYLSPTDEGCVNEVAITISAAVPLIGGKLEAFIAESTAENLAAEYEFIQAYLEELAG